MLKKTCKINQNKQFEMHFSSKKKKKKTLKPKTTL